jgi:hypothetical protein
VLVAVLLIDFYIVGTTIGASVWIVVLVGTQRRSRAAVRFLKSLLVLVVLFVAMNPSPRWWVPQFQRRWLDNRTQLINPMHPIMEDLNAGFRLWHQQEHGVDFDDVIDFETRVRAVDVYIRQQRFHYQYDQLTYGGTFDHLPTIDEILATEDDNGLWRDDCDGISLITCSFLLYLGYNAYISEVTYHYHTMVFRPEDDPKTAEGYLNGVSLYRGRVLADNDKQSYYLFNQTELFIPPTRPLAQSIVEIYLD